MILPSFSFASKKVFAFMTLALLLLALQSVPGQEQETKYTMEEYKAYQEITAETSPAKKTSLVVAFFKAYPKSTLKPNVVASYQSMMGQLQSGKKWQEIISSGQQYLSAGADDLYTISLITTAYQETKNYRQFVTFGEKVFAQKPTPNLAYYIAKAYQDLRDDPKFMVWAEKTVQLMPDNHEMLLELTRRYGLMQDNARAAKYAKLGLKALQEAKMPEGTPPDAWKNYTTGGYALCYGVIGNVAYEAQDYKTAIANLENSLKYYKRSDLAYYNLGLAYWRTNRIDLAMLNLAKAYLLNGNASRAAKGHLDNLYKSTHNQSLVGQDRIIAMAQAQLKQ